MKEPILITTKKFPKSMSYEEIIHRCLDCLIYFKHKTDNHFYYLSFDSGNFFFAKHATYLIDFDDQKFESKASLESINLAIEDGQKVFYQEL